MTYVLQTVYKCCGNTVSWWKWACTGRLFSKSPILSQVPLDGSRVGKIGKDESGGGIPGSGRTGGKGQGGLRWSQSSNQKARSGTGKIFSFFKN